MTALLLVPVLVWGGAGHARVLRPILAEARRLVVAIVERRTDLMSPFEDADGLRNEDDVEHWLRQGETVKEYVIAIGGHNGLERCRLAAWLDGFGLQPFSAVHRTAFVAETAVLGSGCQVLATAAICEDVRLGAQTIVNTNATVDHECEIGDGVHVMPGATIAGCVRIGNYASIGANATVLPRIEIGAGAQVGAGAVVTRNVQAGAVVAGVPAKQLAVAT